MRQKLRIVTERIQMGVSAFLVALAAFDMIGKPARLVSILTLAAGCIGIGVSVGVLAERRRTQRNIESDLSDAGQHVE
jgi:hypothetical protein